MGIKRFSRRKKSSKKGPTGSGNLNADGSFTYEPSTEAGLSQMTATYLREHYPEALFNMDVLAGINLSVKQGAQAKKQGKTKSWPDVFIAVARRGFHGLFIEQKKQGERVHLASDRTKFASKHIAAQATMLQRLRDQGYCAEFAVGFAETKELIDWYFEAGTE